MWYHLISLNKWITQFLLLFFNLIFRFWIWKQKVWFKRSNFVFIILWGKSINYFFNIIRFLIERPLWLRLTWLKRCNHCLINLINFFFFQFKFVLFKPLTLAAHVWLFYSDRNFKFSAGHLPHVFFNEICCGFLGAWIWRKWCIVTMFCLWVQ